MKKKGFTLMEVILSLALITVIGVSSFFGVRIINKNNVVKELKQITDKALQAAEVYIETNKETYNQLYQEKNGTIIPLNVLVNEGLLDITSTKLDDKDIENNYVYAMLASGGSTSDCIDLKTKTSWEEGTATELYICTDKTTGNTNISMIDPSSLNNYNKVNREIYYFKGKYTNNYINYTKNGKTYEMRIISVDTDDTLTVAYKFPTPSTETFKNIFKNEEVMNFNSEGSGYFNQLFRVCKNSGAVTNFYGIQPTYDGYIIGVKEYFNTTECIKVASDSGIILSDSNWITIDDGWEKTYRYIHLKSCMKIKSGTGAEDNPFILEKVGTC